MIKDAIGKLAAQENLSQAEAYDAMNDIMSGNASESQIAGFLMGLRLKGESVDEIAGCARSMREKATPIKSKHESLIDTCGTGGDAAGTFNVSTTAAIIASAAGAAVAKHGNRAVSSQCGSADVLKALGLNIEIPPEKATSVLDHVGITFLFAPLMHGAMKFAAPVRRELGIRTIFNILGPLTNPAGAKRQLLGVFDARLTEIIAGVLRELGSDRAVVVHGQGGFDELSTLGWSKISEVRGGEITTYEISAHDFGFTPARAVDLKGGEAELNARIIQSILNGDDGAPRDMALLNAAAAIMVAGLARSIREGISVARGVVDSGAAQRKLSHWIEATNS